MWREFLGLDEVRSNDDLVGDSAAEAQPPGPRAAIRGLPASVNEQAENTAKATAAVWTVANWYGSVFAGCSVEAGNPAAGDAVKPEVLALMAVEMVLDGASTWDVVADELGVRLVHLANAQVYGKRADPRSWYIRAYTPTPSGQEAAVRLWEAVVHPVRSPKPERPWEGTGVLAGLTSRLLWTAERNAIDRLAGPHGGVMDWTYNGEGTQTMGKQAKADRASNWAALRGQLAHLILDRKWTASYNEVGQGAALDPVEKAIAAADHAAAGIRDAALLPIHFMPGQQRVTASALKEALIHFTDSACKPLARIIASELSAKLGTPIELGFSHVGRSDVRARSTALKNLVDSAVPLDEARRLTGFDMP